MSEILECIPNISEGKDSEIINKIAHAITSIENVKLLDINSGRDANRTVFTFAGPANKVCEAAYVMVKKASELIDMSNHRGIHPRFGAVDVLPLVPLANITMEKTVKYSRALGKRIGEELGIPVYCYEYSAFVKSRSNLATVRNGQYEGLQKRLLHPDNKPDFGPGNWNKNIAHTGAIALGARDLMVAYNVNLATSSVDIAKEIAGEIRESGIPSKKPGGKKSIVNSGNLLKHFSNPGLLSSVKAIGWYVEEYKMTQVSMNLTNLNITPLHIAFETVRQLAEKRKIKVHGSEIVGMVPLQTMLYAGRYFRIKKGLKTDISENELIDSAIDNLGLNSVVQFDPDKKILDPDKLSCEKSF